MAQLRTPDGRYLVIDGRLWRASDPSLDDGLVQTLTSQLMAARRAVHLAQRRKDEEALRAARRHVDRAKKALGERGPVWWTDGAPDLNRRLAGNTPYSDWFERQMRWESEILSLLADRRGGSICPSEIARRVEPRRWRGSMEEVRDAARRLAVRGLVVITQRGSEVPPDTDWHGPVRIRLVSGAGA